MPENSPVPNESTGREAGEILNDYFEMSAAAVDATQTGGWTYEDGTAWDPETIDNVFYPLPCGEGADGTKMRSLVMTLLGPAPEDPAAARDRVQTYLEANDYVLGTVVDPAPGTAPKNTFAVTAQRSDGAIVDYGANDGEQILTLESECSDHPSLENEVRAGS